MTFEGTPADQQAQRDALENFIQQDDYLKNHRGEYMKRYAILSPWRSDIDLKLTQTYRLKGSQKIQFNLNILNLGNLLNKNWGVVKLPVTKQPIGVRLTDSDSDGIPEPVYSFDTSLTHTYYNDYSMRSRWQIQAGLRFSF